MKNYKTNYGKVIAGIDTDDNDKYFSITVSPYEPNFEDNLEEGIKEVVFAFLNKNYMTINSCEGHDSGWDNPYITLAFVEENEREDIIKKMKKIPFVTFELKKYIFNIKFVDKNNKKFKIIDESNYDVKLEAQSVNNLYLKKYKNYCYLEIVFFKYSDNLFQRYFMLFMKRLFFKIIKNKLISIIKSKEFSVYDK